MKKLRMYKHWGLYELNAREEKEYGFKYAPIHPDTMEAYGPAGANCLTPGDADMECETLQQAEDHINSY